MFSPLFFGPRVLGPRFFLPRSSDDEDIRRSPKLTSIFVPDVLLSTLDIDRRLRGVFMLLKKRSPGSFPLFCAFREPSNSDGDSMYLDWPKSIARLVIGETRKAEWDDRGEGTTSSPRPSVKLACDVGGFIAMALEFGARMDCVRASKNRGRD